MAQKYINISEQIDRAHKMKSAFPCMEFKYDINPYLGYWYAEDRLYVLHDCMIDAYFFEIANSPKDAVEKVMKRWEEAEHAGEKVAEEYE